MTVPASDGRKRTAKICKIYSWTNAAAAAEVKHQLRQALEGVPADRSPEVSQTNGRQAHGNVACGQLARDDEQKALGLHKSYWYDKQQYSTNQLEEPAVLAMKGKQMVAGLQRNYLPIEAAMKMVVADNARLWYSSVDVLTRSHPTRKWAKAAQRRLS